MLNENKQKILKCASCGTQNPSDVAYCLQCKKVLPISLPQSQTKPEKSDNNKKVKIIIGIIIVLSLSLILFLANSSLLNQKDKSGISQKLIVDGIMYSKDKPFLMISGEVYYLNDSIGAGKIINISSSEATIRFPQKTVVYKVGETIR